MKLYAWFSGFTTCLVLLCSVGCMYAAQSITHTSPDGRYTYTTVPGDQLGMRVYTLGNGLKVYLSVNKSEPRIQTMIATRAGSKYDPADATGLAHYLEHLLFKGTDTFGTADYATEKRYLDHIEELYEQYRATANEQQRAAIYRAIDSVSGIAAQYAIANEYDKMVGMIGASGTNAWTSEEQVVYINDIPSNQLERWLFIEGERFRKPVLRLFHTELEAVYEEKNISIDDDGDQAYEKLMAGLFPRHPYGTQTTIGTIPHLKNPSIKAIKRYLDTYYVPNNMAVCLAGDFDPDHAIAAIDRAFGALQKKEVKPPVLPNEKPLARPVVHTVVGPQADEVLMAFRFPGAGNRDVRVMQMIDMILSNRTAGLIDLNLNNTQKVLHATCSPDIRNDYSVHMFSGEARDGQSLEAVRDLLLAQIDLVKKGKFDKKLLPAIINDFRTQKMKANERNFARAHAAIDAFTKGMEWAEYSAEIDELRSVTVQDIIRVAKQYYGKNYSLVFKRTGERQEQEKVVKPAITPVAVNREAQSPFLQKLVAMPAEAIKPHFVEFNRDLDTAVLVSGVPVYHAQNNENDLFSLYYVFDIGSMHDKTLAYAVEYLQYLGTPAMSRDEFNRQLYALGCSFSVASGEREVQVSLSGLKENIEQGVQLLENLLNNPKPDAKALASFVDRTLKERADRKKNKHAILRGAMAQYAQYGRYNPYTNSIPERELRALTAEELAAKIKGLSAYSHRVLYYGPHQAKELVAILDTRHIVPAVRSSVPKAAEYSYRTATADTVFFVHYDMVQAEVMWVAKTNDEFQPQLVPAITLYNEYYGGGMSSLVFQTIRESKALAYSTYAYYSQPSRRNAPHFMMAYVGTQSDKLHEAILSMDSLLQEMPKAELAFTNAHKALTNKIETERTLRQDVLFAYEQARRLGIQRVMDADVYDKLPSITLETLVDLHKQQIASRHFTLLVLGSRENINTDELSRYGVVKELTLEEVFGY